MKLGAIRSDHGTEFENSLFKAFCEEHGISHNFSAPRTPQQNGVVERKNRTLEEMGRTLLISSKLPREFWNEAIRTSCYILNRALIRPLLNKTSYELFRNRTPNVSHLKVFGCRCYIHNNGKDNLEKFDPRSDEGVFLGYSKTSRAFRVFNNRTGSVEESIHVVFDESTFGEIKNYNSSSDGDFPQMQREESDGENDSNDRSRSTSSRHNNSIPSNSVAADPSSSINTVDPESIFPPNTEETVTVPQGTSGDTDDDMPALSDDVIISD